MLHYPNTRYIAKEPVHEQPRECTISTPSRQKLRLHQLGISSLLTDFLTTVASFPEMELAVSVLGGYLLFRSGRGLFSLQMKHSCNHFRRHRCTPRPHLCWGRFREPMSLFFRSFVFWVAPPVLTLGLVQTLGWALKLVVVLITGSPGIVRIQAKIKQSSMRRLNNRK